MKKLILILVLLTTYAYSQTKVSDMDSITTMVTTDLFWINKDIGSSTFAHRQLSWTNLRNQMIDYIDGLANTWALKQTYSSGATFSAGANGGVTFGDTVTANAPFRFGYAYNLPTADATVSLGGFVGVTPYWFSWVWTHNIGSDALWVYNDERNDSVSITYDDSTLTFDKKITVGQLSVTGSFAIPDSATFDGLALSEDNYSPSFVTDSVITLTSVSSSIIIIPPGAMATPGIEKVLMTGAGEGQLLVITNYTASSVTFQDDEGDGNLKLAGDFAMGQADILMLKYSSAKTYWYEISRSAN